MDLTGKVAMVTGGGIRVGKVLSLALAKAGADLVISHYMTEQESMETKKEIEAMGRRCLLVEANMRSIPQLENLVAQTEQEFGRLDILVHNASNFNIQSVDEITEEIFNQSMDILVKGPLFLSRAAAKLMLKHKFGRMIAIIGNSYYENTPSYLVHGLAKSSLARLMKFLAVEYTPYVQCTSICPDTIMQTANKKVAEYDERDDDISKFEDGCAEIGGRMIRRGDANDLAEMVLFLSSCTSYMNGDVIALDGGRHLL